MHFGPTVFFSHVLVALFISPMQQMCYAQEDEDIDVHDLNMHVDVE